MGYLRLLFVLIGFIGLGFLFLGARLPEEIDKRLAEKKCFTEAAIAEAWKHHEKRLPEWDGLLDRPAAANPQIDEAQKRNMRVYLLLCQVIQVSLLSFVVWGFFLALGRLAVTDKVLGDWFPNGGPQYPAHLLTIPIPWFSTQLVEASALMAILASIIFTVQAVTDSGFRDEFFTSTVDGLMQAVSVWCAYQTLLNKPEVIPPPLPGAPSPSESPAPAEPAQPTATAS